MGDNGHLVEPQQNAKRASVSSWNHNQEEPREAFKFTPVLEQLPDDQRFAGFAYLHQLENSINDAGGGGGEEEEHPSSSGGCFGLEDQQKLREKRGTKMERVISLEVLHQHFAGSLKDAAKNIGVCPTTLKRICRQHGIRRWPSRKIKKVGHSLRKLQMVIDSVHGAQNVPIGCFYTNFPELSSLSISGSDPSSSEKTQQPETCCIRGDGVSAAPSTCCSQNAGAPCTSCSGDACKQQNMSGEDPSGLLLMKRAFSDAQLHAVTVNDEQLGKLLERSQSEKTLGASHLRSARSIKSARLEGSFGVKVTLGDAKIRFSLQPSWGFQELQQEIVRRFGIEDVRGIKLKYLDDDHEWVLLICDADLAECRDLHKSAGGGGRTIKISIYHTQPHSRPSSFSSITGTAL